MDHTDSSLPNPNPNILFMALHFTKALANLSSSSHRHSHSHRRRRISRAAYASMAAAAGPRRAWSRALLRRLRSCGRRANAQGPVRVLRTAGRAESLRSLVPGGEEMSFCRLLEESASYIQCLSAQVKLMRSMVELSSSI